MLLHTALLSKTISPCGCHGTSQLFSAVPNPSQPSFQVIFLYFVRTPWPALCFSFSPAWPGLKPLLRAWEVRKLGWLFPEPKELVQRSLLFTLAFQIWSENEVSLLTSFQRAFSPTSRRRILEKNSFLLRSAHFPLHPQENCHPAVFSLKIAALSPGAGHSRGWAAPLCLPLISGTLASVLLALKPTSSLFSLKSCRSSCGYYFPQVPSFPSLRLALKINNILFTRCLICLIFMNLKILLSVFVRLVWLLLKAPELVQGKLFYPGDSQKLQPNGSRGSVTGGSGQIAREWGTLIQHERLHSRE